MKRRLFRSSRATRVGLIIGSVTVIAASALTAVASTSTKATRPSVSNTLTAAPKHTKVPPVKGVTAPALVTRRSATIATPMTASPASS